MQEKVAPALGIEPSSTG